MPTQPDSIDIDQLRSQLETIYSNAETPVEPAYSSPAQPSVDYPKRGLYEVSVLTDEAKSHSPEFVGPKVERIAAYGANIGSLRTTMMRTRNR